MISREVSFESKVCLTLKLSLNPSVHGEQAGLVLYLDDDHYCKVVREWIGSLKALAIVSAREEEGKGKALKVEALEGKVISLRMVKLGDRVVCFGCAESEEKFKLLSDTTLPKKEGAELKLALVSAGAKGDVDHWAEFHSLTI